MQQLAETNALSMMTKLTSGDCVRSGIVFLGNGKGMLKVPYIISPYVEDQLLSNVFNLTNELDRCQMAASLGATAARIHLENHDVHSPSTPMESLSDCFAKMSSQNVDKRELDSKKSRPEMAGVSFVCLEDLHSWMKSEILEKGTFFQAQHPNRVWSSISGLISLKTPPNQHSPTITLSFQEDGFSSYGHWSPFLNFLEWRKSLVLRTPSNTELPDHLLSQISAYLPDSVVDLTCACSGAPSMLHGDLTADNVLVNGEETSQTTVIDFGDAGYGDPLYDFVAASLSSLRGDASLTEAFAVAYWKTSLEKSKRKEHLWMSRRKFSLSYCAMCYAILHEDCVMEWLFAVHPEYAHFKTLNEIEQSVWGVLDQSLATIT